MKIKIISDSHNDHNELTDLECDVLIHCGDFGTKGNYTEAENFLFWFVKQPAKYKILVPGNHDRRIKTHTDLIMLAHNLGIHMLMNDPLEINGIKMYGVCDVFWSENKENNASQQARQEAWKDIPEGLDILITHMPPKYILDMSQEKLHCGCTQLTEKVKEVKPKYHIFGHLHEQGGKQVKVYDTIFINASVKNRQYLTVRGATEIEL